MRATTKAVIKLFSGADGKTGRFFVVKGATSGVIRTRFFKRHTFIHHIDDIDTI